MTRSPYPPVRHPETGLPGHWEGDREWVDGKRRYIYIDRWVPHCPTHPRYTTPCAQCAAEPTREG